MLILLSVVFGILFLFLFFYIYPHLTNEEIRIIQRNQEEVVFNIARQLEIDLGSVRDNLMKIVEFPEFSSMDIPGQQRIIDDYIRFLQPVTSLHVMDAKGWFVSSSGDLSIHRARSYADRPFFTIPFEQGGIYFYPPRFYSTTGIIGTSVNVPIQSDTGRRVGVLSGGMRLTELITYVTEYPLTEGAVVFLIDREGTVVAHSGIDLFALKEGPLSLNFGEQALVQATMEGKTAGSQEYDKEGTRYLGSYGTLESSGWGVVAEIPMRLVLAQSNAFAWRLTLVTVVVFAGAFLALLFFARQITEEQKQKEEIIRESEERYRTLFQGAAEGILVTDIETKKFKYANPAICEMLGYTEKELQGMGVPDIHPEKNLAHVLSEFEAQARGEKSLAENIPCLRKDRTIIYADINTAKILIDEEECNVGFFTDITERRKAERKIEAYQKRLRSLASELTLVEEQEKRHLATELHDSVGQLLALCRIKLGELEKMTEVPDTRSLVQEIEERLEEVIWHTRSLTSELGPPVLYQLGLEAALQWLADHMKEQYGLLTKVKFTGKSEVADEELRVFLFRTVQELLLNVSKHAKTDTAQVSVLAENESIQISVEDGGIGFNTAVLDTSFDRDVGFGLFSIRERIQYFGGKFKLRSKPGEGTQVTITVPIKG